MGFADIYFERFKIYNSYFPDIPVSPDLKLTIVIPSYREFKLFRTLECLSKCEHDIVAEVIVVFNAKFGEDEQILEIHQVQAQKVPDFSTEKLKFIPIIEHNLPPKIAGAGLARKLGMDAALYRFNSIDYKDGIIVSLDADTLCDSNYIQAIYQEFEKHKKAPGATIVFEHPIEGDEFPPEIYQAIILYELYMRYYIQAQRFVHFPYAYHTVGSAFAVKAWAYANQGGMGLQQAGEDFYFLHKIIPLGNFFEIKSTKVYPSPRLSNRVVFGTGPAIRQIISKKMTDFDTYPLDLFLMLKDLFENVESYFARDPDISKFHPVLSEYLKNNYFHEALNQMRKNSSSPATFRKRFFAWFDAFRILKFLNFAIEQKKIPQQPVTQEARKLLKLLDVTPGFTARELLLTYRKLQNQ